MYFQYRLQIMFSTGFMRHIQVQYRNSQLKTINDSHQLYHALAYPLLFPTGSSGWHPQMESNGRPISLCEYMRYKIMHREQPTHVQRCERLALEFYCDAWAQVESRNLAFHQQACQQAKYQASSARAIFDQLSQDNARQIGVPVVLPDESQARGMPNPHSKFTVCRICNIRPRSNRNMLGMAKDICCMCDQFLWWQQQYQSAKEFMTRYWAATPSKRRKIDDDDVDYAL